MKKYALLLFMFVGLIACGKKEMSIKKYYFPYASFMTPQVYKYVDKKDSTLVMYWYFKTNVKDKDTAFTTFLYDADFKPTHIYANHITTEGVRYSEMYAVTNVIDGVASGSIQDTTVVIKWNIKKNEVFKWKIKPTDKLLASCGFSNNEGKELENIVIERSFEPKKVLLNFNGKEYECLVAKDLLMLNHIKPNRTFSEEQQRSSFFAEGIGLLAYETFNANGTSTYFELKKIMGNEEWINLSQSSPDSSDTATR